MNNIQKAKNTNIVKHLASKYGFDNCGIARAEFLSEEAKRLETWLKKGYQAQLKYLERNFDKRMDPRILVPGAKTVISLTYNYFPKVSITKKIPKIARYAYGNDYHLLIKQKLKLLVDALQRTIGKIQGRVFVDSAPVKENVWAQKSGMGWIGKNTLLINPKKGSYYFLAEIISDLDLIADTPLNKNYCGTCTACIDACPTGAILESNELNIQQCISYLTIELKDDVPQAYQNKLNGWLFGCDICQEVCPWNRFSKPTAEEAFSSNQWKELSLNDWKDITEETFKILFKKSPLNRAKLKKIKKTLHAIIKFNTLDNDKNRRSEDHS